MRPQNNSSRHKVSGLDAANSNVDTDEVDIVWNNGDDTQESFADSAILTNDSPMTVWRTRRSHSGPERNFKETREVTACLDGTSVRASAQVPRTGTRFTVPMPKPSQNTDTKQICKFTIFE
jgi:hypothetical protein